MHSSPCSPFVEGRLGVARLCRLLRKCQVAYYDSFNPDDGVLQRPSHSPKSHPADFNITPYARPSGVSVRKAGDTCLRSKSHGNLEQVYREICVLCHPSLKGHPYIPELLGMTLLTPFGESLEPIFGLITDAFHGTLEDLLAIERKATRDLQSNLISWTEREDIVLQCAEGIAALHDCNIVHNDVRPSSFAIFITHPTPDSRVINVKVSGFANAILLTPGIAVDDIAPANGEWGSVSPLATCEESPFCRDIHSFGLMVMYLCYYEFMDLNETIDFLRTQKGFYEELGFHPALDTALSLFRIVSKCCISHDDPPVTMHSVAPMIKKDHCSIVVKNDPESLQGMVTDVPPITITELLNEFQYLRAHATARRSLYHHLFQESIQTICDTFDITTTLYLSFCYAYGIGVARNEYSSLQLCMLAAENGSIPAKSVAKMLYDAYIKSSRIESSQKMEKLNEMERLADSYLLEALKALEEVSALSGDLDEDMTRVCQYLNKTRPLAYAEDIYPGLRWTILDPLLRVFNEEEILLRPSRALDCHAYTRTLAYAIEMQSQFPLSDGSTMLHCLAYLVHPDAVTLGTLANVVIASGSDLTAVRYDGMTAIELAVQLGNTGLVAVLASTYDAFTNPELIRRLRSLALGWHQYEILQLLSNDPTSFESSLRASDLEIIAPFKVSKMERFITRGKTCFADAYRVLENLFGNDDIRNYMDDPTLLAVVTAAVISGNDDLLCYKRWDFPVALSESARCEMIRLTMDLGEHKLLRRLLGLSNLDYSSALQLLKCAILNPVMNMQTIEIILERYQTSEEEYIIDLVERGPIASDFVSKIAKRNPHILSLHFGNKGKTLVHHAIASGKVTTAKTLVKHGAAINTPDNDGNTPLHVAVENVNNESCLRWLLSLTGITIEARNKTGQTPLLYATHVGNFSAAELLLEHRADVNAVTDDGHTALHLAYARYCEHSVARLDGNKTILAAQVEEKRASETLARTLKVLSGYGADENFEDYIMGFNPKTYFAWLLETKREQIENNRA